MATGKDGAIAEVKRDGVFALALWSQNLSNEGERSVGENSR